MNIKFKITLLLYWEFGIPGSVWQLVFFERSDYTPPTRDLLQVLGRVKARRHQLYDSDDIGTHNRRVEVDALKQTQAKLELSLIMMRIPPINAFSQATIYGYIRISKKGHNSGVLWPVMHIYLSQGSCIASLIQMI